MRRYGERRDPDQIYTHRPGVYAALIRGGDILLTVEANAEFGTAEVQLPGGGIDPGEMPVRALYREVMEETGWTITTPRRLGAYQRYCYMQEYDLWAHKICHIYVAAPALRKSDPLEDHHATLWAPFEDLLEILTNDEDRQFLADNWPRLVSF